MRGVRFLPLLALAASVARAETWPTRLGESDRACLESLREADAVVRDPHREARIGLFGKLRATLDLCDRAEVDARFAARAARLAMILPEYSRPQAQIEALEAAARRLDELSTPPPELVRTLDDLAGALCSAGRVQQARSVFNRLVELRKSVFGDRSFEAAMGLIHLAQFHASKESAGEAFNEDLARELGIQAVELVAESQAGGAEYFKVLGAYAALLEALGRKEAAEELTWLFHRLSEGARGRAASPPIERWDEPLPEP
jgi:hypothetical protein